MVATITFSGFTNGGDLSNGATTVGLSGGTNAYFDNPWTFLPDGSTSARPAPISSIYYRLRLNTDTQLYEYYNPISVSWIQLAISASAVFQWTTVTGPTTMLTNNGYFTNSSSTLTLSLPLVSALGDRISISGIGSGWQITQNASQSITIGTSKTTVGVGGSVTSSHFSDSINLVCSESNIDWTLSGAPQSSFLTIV